MITPATPWKQGYKHCPSLAFLFPTVKRGRDVKREGVREGRSGFKELCEIISGADNDDAASGRFA